jgi:hypothetical protein
VRGAWAEALSWLDGTSSDGIHLLWTAPSAVGYSMDGFDIERRPARPAQDEICHTLSGDELARLHADLRVDTVLCRLALWRAPGPQVPTLADAPYHPDEDAPPDGRSGGATPVVDWWVYAVTVAEPVVGIRVDIDGSEVLAVALRERKAVATRHSAGTSRQLVSFDRRVVDEVLLYMPEPATALTICIVPPDPFEAHGWALIARRVQLPVRRLDASLASNSDELAQAESRLLPGEALDRDAFAQAAQVLNDTLEAAAGAAPQTTTLLTRARPDDRFAEVRPWPLTLALTVEPAWRRALGFGFRDDAGLVGGEAYDYRITGRFRRAHLEERLYGFHTVPIGTTLPTSFHLGDLALQTATPAVVELDGTPPDGALTYTARKGITVAADSAAGDWIELTFPHGVRRVALELAPTGDHFDWVARTTASVLGLGGPVFSGGASARARVDLEFPEAIDHLQLKQTLTLYGVRVGLPPGASPDEVLERSVVVRNVRFESTAPPAPPVVVGTTHLQEPTPPGAPPQATPRAPNDMGFRIRWPAPADGGPVFTWPVDLAATPPTGVVGYRLERRRVDGAGEGPFEPLDAKDRLYFADRRAPQVPEVIAPGVDVLALFPDAYRPTPPVPLHVEAQDVVIGVDGAGPPPGSLHQYRVRSVDALGRHSVPVEGSVVRLEKRRPPPAPPDVRVRVLQATDVASDDDRRLLGTARNVIVVEWDWRSEERGLDPFATEFRVYFHPEPPDLIRGDLVGLPRGVPGGFEFDARLDRDVTAGEMVGVFIPSGNHAFRIAGHGAGRIVTLRLQTPSTDVAAVPEPGPFVFRRLLDGRELTPSAGWERVGVQPIDGPRVFVFRDRLAIDAARPSARVWVGVSAADDQGYVPDTVISGPFAGRRGNEGRLAVATALARYRGQPSFAAPPPVAEVPEILSDEPAAGQARVRLELDRLLAGVAVPDGHTLRLERMPMVKVLSRLSAMAGAEPDADTGVRVAGADGTAPFTYLLPNPADARAFVAQVRSGTAARVANRFLLRLLIDRPDGFQTLWETTLHEAVPRAGLDDFLPAQAERYVYRARLVDQAGHRSRETALVPAVVRVPSLRVPGAPEITAAAGTGAEVVISCRRHDAADLRWLVVFTLTQAPTGASTSTHARPQALRQPNLRDRYPHVGLRLRLGDGQVIAPSRVTALSPGPVDGAEQRLTVTVTVAPDRQVLTWAMLVTRDGVPSPVAGPAVVVTAPAPPLAPVLTLEAPVASPAGEDTLTWTAVPPGCEAWLDRSPDGRRGWVQVSPRLPAATNRWTASAPGPEVRVYRLVVRDRTGQTAISKAVRVAAEGA